MKNPFNFGKTEKPVDSQGVLLKVYCIYDSKAENFGQPMVFESRGLALRAFTEASNDPNGAFGKFSADFTLFEVGEWDKFDGIMQMYESKINLGTALEFKQAAPARPAAGAAENN